MGRTGLASVNTFSGAYFHTTVVQCPAGLLLLTDILITFGDIFGGCE